MMTIIYKEEEKEEEGEEEDEEEKIKTNKPTKMGPNKPKDL